MAQITTVAMLARDIKNMTNSFTSLSMSFSPTLIAATVTNADRILIATLPANAKIVGATVKLTGTSGVTALAALQVVEPTGNVVFLSATTLTPSVAISVVMTQGHVPITSVTATRDLEIVCATGSISVTNGLLWYVDCQYAFYP